LKLLAGRWRCVSCDPGDPNDTGLPSQLDIEREYDGWSFSVRDELADKSGYHAGWSCDGEAQEIVMLGREPLGAWFEATSPRLGRRSHHLRRQAAQRPEHATGTLDRQARLH
jgi:hypothetical protein